MKKFKINFHLIFLIVLVLCIGFVIYRIFTWGNKIESQYDPNATHDELDVEVLDYIVPNFTPEDELPPDDGVTTVLLLGNSPLADQKTGEDSLGQMIAKLGNAKVYDCSVPGTLQSSISDQITAEEHPMDAFSLYWLSVLMTGTRCDIYQNAFRILGDETPVEAYDAYDTLTSIDYNTVDVLAVMYDGSDFLEGIPLYSDENPDDIRTFRGSMESSLSLIQETYPHIRIIVMSPAYCFVVNEDGTYEKSDYIKVGGYTFSTYATLMEQIAYTHSSSFVDNIYGTITEGNAEEYLIDNIHLNVEGRKKMAERFVYALTYFNETHY